MIVRFFLLEAREDIVDGHASAFEYQLLRVYVPSGQWINDRWKAFATMAFVLCFLPVRRFTQAL